MSVYCFSDFYLSRYYTFSYGNFTALGTMTGGTFHQDGINPSWRKVSFSYRSMCPQLEKQAALAALFAITLLRFNKSFTAEVMKCTSYRRLRQFEVARYRRYSGPALAILVRTVKEINIHRHGAVRQLGAVEKIKTAHSHARFRSS